MTALDRCLAEQRRCVEEFARTGDTNPHGLLLYMGDLYAEEALLLSEEMRTFSPQSVDFSGKIRTGPGGATNTSEALDVPDQRRSDAP